MKFDLKTFVTVCMTLALIVFTFMDKVDSTLFTTTCGAVFAYYFNKDLKRGEVGNGNKKENIESEQNVTNE